MLKNILFAMAICASASSLAALYLEGYEIKTRMEIEAPKELEPSYPTSTGGIRGEANTPAKPDVEADVRTSAWELQAPTEAANPEETDTYAQIDTVIPTWAWRERLATPEITDNTSWDTPNDDEGPRQTEREDNAGQIKQGGLTENTYSPDPLPDANSTSFRHGHRPVILPDGRQAEDLFVGPRVFPISEPGKPFQRLYPW